MESCLERWPASRANQTRAWWVTAAVAVLALGVAAAAPAHASVTIGQLPTAAPSPRCTVDADYLQPSVTGGNLYIARQAGTITSWSTNSFNSGATYVFKVFRRTSDPDVFQVIAHSEPHSLLPGLNTVPVSIPVRSGDMIGIDETGAPNSCTFVMPGDSVLSHPGDLSDGAAGEFSAVDDVRLNLSAVLVPSNDFTLGTVTRDRRRGSASVTAYVSNPGLVTISGTGLRKRDLAKTVAVPGPVLFQIASAGSFKRRLERKGKVTVSPTVTFYPTGGDPASKSITVRLRKRRPVVKVMAVGAGGSDASPAGRKFRILSPT
jgi:hypothetical protein